MTKTEHPTGGGTRPPAVELTGLSKRFGEVTAISDLSLTAEAGELISILGASGSGKTTLLRLVAGFETPTTGSIRLHGREVASLSPAEREIGMVFQNYALFPHLSVRRNIEYGLRMRGWSRERRVERSAELLARMRLDQLGDRLPRQLSGGQQQRVAIARALAYSPRLVLMDEPLGALDKALKENLLAEIRRVHREFGTTILYVTHDREEALTLSDRVAIMRDTRLVCCSPVRELYLDPPNGYVAGFFAQANVIPLTPGGPVALRRRGAADAEVAVGERRHTLALQGAAAAAETLALAIRPGQVRPAAGDEDLPLPGTVSDLVFLGDTVRLRVAVPELAEPVSALAPAHAALGLAVGDRVTLGLPREHLRLLPEGS
ncbi:ABC transporter ATP-binding protein [Streptomyces sp. DSM 44915]|uniref:ABC transporter ATP-binding protein n=1 Tax=Streptomyces chisholmiae TaxID=3075540 RepID=A0ABU2JV34_9ACTN|nr:ABC transporter ATP-binding protein [Streptomyces sp. DSM 44915]MDT0268845.1 ABC transporter ATP-binding protein [Streptomyces sp. DSM 44915]